MAHEDCSDAEPLHDVVAVFPVLPRGTKARPQRALLPHLPGPRRPCGAGGTRC